MKTMKDEIPTFDAIVRQLGVESGITEWHALMGGSMIARGNDILAQARVLQLMGYAGTLDEISHEIYVHQNARYLALRKTGGNGRGVDKDGVKLSDKDVPTPAHAYKIKEEVFM
jgi:hypothetical protein